MKKVIKNSVYDTDTAEKIGEWDNRERPGDLNYIAEALYRTKSGKYFLHGVGGARTQYGVWNGNTGRAGEVIRPMPYDDAREWAEEHMDGDSYIEAFGDPEDGERVQMAILISAAARRKLEMIRAETGENMTVIIERLIMEGAQS